MVGVNIRFPVRAKSFFIAEILSLYQSSLALSPGDFPDAYLIREH